MKKLVLILLTLLVSSVGYSEHIVGYDMAIENITGTDSYKFKLRVYKDNLSPTTPLPNSIHFDIYDRLTNANVGININAVKVRSYFSSGNSIGCITYGQANSLEVGEFEYVISEGEALALNSPGHYYIASEVCCRSTTINTPMSNQFPFIFVMDINSLGSGSVTRFNNSPIFNVTPDYIFTVNKIYTLDWSATDVDGDSLVYSMTKPIGDNLGSYPFSTLEYASGYKLDSNIADGSPDFRINKHTGLGVYQPTQTGRYLVALKVEEYRNGVKIGEIRREIQFITVLVIEYPPVLQSQNSSSADIVDTIDFAGNYSVDYNLQINAVDSSIDSLFMYVVPEDLSTSNVFEPTILKAEWGEVGNTQTGDAAIGLLLEGKGSVQSEFKWKIYDYMGRSSPYRFMVIVRDMSCPDGHKDTMNITIVVPETGCFFNNTALLSGCDSVLGINGKMYYKSGTYFDVERVELACDTTYLQYITVGKSPMMIGVVGPSYAQPQKEYTYYFYRAKPNVCYWSVDNGVVISQDDSVAVISFASPALSKITVEEFGKDGCSTINEKLVNVTGVGVENEKETSVNIHPNPSAGKIYLDGLSNKETLVEIYSFDGKKLYSTNIKNKKVIDISDLQSGVYILKVEGQSRRIIKM